MVPTTRTHSSRFRSPAQKRKGFGQWVHILIITSLSFIVYFNSLSNGFVGDDNGLIKENISIRSLQNIPAFFYSPATMAADPELGTLIYPPLRTVSYALDYHLFGLNSTGYHVTNLVLHILVCITLYYLIIHFFNVPLVALLGALIFAIHPVHVEAVSWIASRAELIGFFFFNLSLLCYITYQKHIHSIKYLALSLIFSFLAYLGKESMIPLPGVIILYDYITEHKKTLRDIVQSRIFVWGLFSLVCLGYLVLRFYVTGRMSQHEGWWGGSTYSNFLMMIKATAAYLKLLIFPFKLNLHYIIEPVYSVFNPKVLISLLVILLSVSAIIYFHKKNKIIFFTLVWFYLSLVPIANIVPIKFTMMAERYIYMPSVGPIIAMAYGINFLYQKAKVDKGILWSSLVIGMIVLIFTTFSISIIIRNKAYKDEFTFYTTAVKDSPDSAPSYKGLGDQYFEREDYPSAITNYEKAIAIDPNYAEAFAREAVVFQKVKGNVSARLKAEKAVSLKPESATIRFTVGNVYKDMGDLANALMQWEKAIELNPYYSEAYNHLGNYYQMIYDYSKAVVMYEQSLKSNPFNAEAYYNIAKVYEVQGDLAKAKDHYRRFIELAGPEHQDLLEDIKKEYL